MDRSTDNSLPRCYSASLNFSSIIEYFCKNSIFSFIVEKKYMFFLLDRTFLLN